MNTFPECVALTRALVKTGSKYLAEKRRARPFVSEVAVRITVSLNGEKFSTRNRTTSVVDVSFRERDISLVDVSFSTMGQLNSLVGVSFSTRDRTISVIGVFFGVRATSVDVSFRESYTSVVGVPLSTRDRDISVVGVSFRDRD
ncbi:hypothetical protein Bbelb_224890 [Branchiostoma belcheri]|nr:hypothetical protein Bbelb_224890 [Branchiostoma belcheri]